MLMSELSCKVLRSSKPKCSIRSQRKHCAPDPAFCSTATFAFSKVLVRNPC